jgi:hypothetical protein
VEHEDKLEVPNIGNALQDGHVAQVSAMIISLCSADYVTPQVANSGLCTSDEAEVDQILSVDLTICQVGAINPSIRLGPAAEKQTRATLTPLSIR